MFKKLLSILNINPDTNQKYILLSLFVSGLLITYASPAITKAIITELPAEWIAFESLFSSIAGLFIGILWKGNIRKSIMTYFATFCVIECLAGFITAMWLCFINYNVWIFAISTLLYSSFICQFVGKCVMAFKAKLWTDKGREIYDNNMSVVAGIYCIIGFSLALLFMPTLHVALFIWGMCCIIDDIGWLIVYFKNKNELKTIE